MNYKKMSFISGVIVFLAIVTFFSSILWLSGKNILFSQKYIVYFKFKDVVGLRDRSAVFMRGYRIGWTKDVYFEDDGVKIRIDIKDKFQIPKDSKIEINTLNFIGEKAVTITPGKSEEAIQPYEIVWGTNKDIMILAKKILLATKEKIEEGEFNKQLEDVSQSVTAFRDFLNTINKQVKKIDMDMYHRQIKNVGQASEKLSEFLASAKDDTRQFSADSNVSMKKLNQTMEKLDKTLEELAGASKEIKEITAKINSGQGTAGKLLNDQETIDRLNRTIGEFNQFLSDIKKHPKKYVKFSIF